MTMVDFDPENGDTIVFHDGKIASFKDGEWHPGALFTSAYMLDYFRIQADPLKVKRILDEAKEALQTFNRDAES